MNKQGEITPYDKIKGKSFFLFEDIDMSKAFFLSDLFFSKTEFLEADFAKAILKSKMDYFTCDTIYEQKLEEKGTITFAYSHFFFRFDSLQKFSHFSDNFPEVSYVKALSHSRKDDIIVNQSISYKIKRKYYDYIVNRWRKVLLTCGLSEDELLYLLIKFLEMNIFLKNFSKNFLKKQKLVVVYYDQTPTECALVQRCKKLGISTATLQHGSVFYNISKDFILNEFTDYMLIWNAFTQQQLLKINPQLNKTQIVGIPIYLNYKYQQIAFNKNNACCFFSDTIENDFGKDENQRAIEMLKVFCKINNYTLNIKIRPLENRGFFEQFKDINTNIISTEEKVMEIAVKHEFCVAISTTVFEELAYLKFPVVRFADVSENGYSDITNVGFKTVEQLEKIVLNKAYFSEAIEENHKVFGCCNSKDKYSEFFKQFSIN